MLASNCICDEGAIAIASAVPACPLLEDLNLKENQIGIAGLTAVAGALEHSPKLIALHVGRNPFGDEGVLALTVVLPRCTIEFLSIKENGIGDAGATVFAANLPCIATLKILEIVGNEFGPDGASALTDALPQALHLEEIHLSEESLGYAALANLKAWENDARFNRRACLQPEGHAESLPMSDKRRRSSSRECS